MKYVFSIEGNIGSGKSTLIEKLKNIENVYFLPEPVDTWNTVTDLSGVTILEKYYQDQEKYAFPFQMMAYITRLSLIRAAPEDCIIFTERCVFTDREIFAKMLYDSGKIDHISYSIYNKWFDEFNEHALSGIVYIQTSPETCFNRIITRNRKGETIPLSYLQNCHNYHEKWITNTSTPVLILDGEPEQSDISIEKIKSFCSLKLN